MEDFKNEESSQRARVVLLQLEIDQAARWSAPTREQLKVLWEKVQTHADQHRACSTKLLERQEEHAAYFDDHIDGEIDAKLKELQEFMDAQESKIRSGLPRRSRTRSATTTRPRESDRIFSLIGKSTSRPSSSQY